MASNTNIQITNLDFDSIKANFINYLQSQSTFKDYNFQGSAMSVLLDVLAYNTQYNAYYLNMVANEMFLDSALQRSSVVSHAKLLNYTPKSAIGPTATVNFVAQGVTAPLFTLPKFSNFLSQPINGVNYNFVTITSYTGVPDSNNTVTINNVELKQGIPVNYNFTVNSTTNPNYIFEIPDSNVDTTTLQVSVQKSSTSSAYTIFTPATNYLTLDGTSTVYFLQESLTGNYQIYFGNGVLGQQLADGNIVSISYVTTQGTAAASSNNFTLMDGLVNATSATVVPVTPATNGGDKESISSIKFQAPKSFSAQGRAVSKNDYITAIQQNNLGFAFDAVNVWGGEENNPPVYGQVFVCLKPKGSYNLTTSQKQEIITQVIQPISVLTVKPTIVDPDYTYIKLNLSVYYDPKLTNLTAEQIRIGLVNSIQNFGATSLNTFNSTFNTYDLLSTVQNYDPSIITSDYTMQLQKKFFPALTTPTSYTLSYHTVLKRGTFGSGISSSPAFQLLTSNGVLDGIYFEEIASQTLGVDSISVINPGFNYSSIPTVTISGDGTGATAYATVSGGRIQSITVTNSGNNYTSAVTTITPAIGDTTGQGAAGVVTLQGQYGILRTYYFNDKNVKTILNSNAGTIDYKNGIITLNNFNPYVIDNPLGQFAVTVTPQSYIVSSTYNGIITIDPYDPNSVTVNVIAKSN
jgi:hypothetical protein